MINKTGKTGKPGFSYQMMCSQVEKDSVYGGSFRATQIKS